MASPDPSPTSGLPRADDVRAFAALGWQLPVAAGALSCLAGVIVLVWPGPTLLLIGVAFGILLLVSGLGNLISAVGDGGGSVMIRIVEALVGVLTLLAGLLLTVRPGASVALVVWALGFWFVVTGCLQLARGIAISEQRLYDLAFGLIGIVAGAIVLAQPGIGVATLVWIAGFSFLLRGAVAIALGWKLRSLLRTADATLSGRVAVA